MPEIRVVIADDEPLARRRVRQLLEPYGDVTVAGEAGDGREVVQLVEALRPDLVFLDVQMPERSGFDAVAHRALRSVPVIVFLTAYAQYAARAFDVHATDYLLKPVRPERFRLCMQRARERLALLRAAGVEGSGGAAGSFVVHSRQGQRVIRPEQVDWISALDYYAQLHVEGETVLVREPLAALEARLAPRLFLRVHRSALVNVTRVRAVEHRGERAELLLRDGTRIPVSRRRKRAVLDRFGG